MDRNPPDAAPRTQPALSPEDYYFEGPLMVFTAAHHLKRGSCCGSGCRHCPYRADEPGSAPASNPATHLGPVPPED
jgi:hypothetical protein